jgi:hypothetical protein
MVLENKKDRVIGKLKNGAVELFTDNEPIGRIVLSQV